MGKLGALELVFQVGETWYFCGQMPFVRPRMELLHDTSPMNILRSWRPELAVDTVVGKEVGSEVLKAW